MPNSYAYIENDHAIIGNDYIERQFSTKNDCLITTNIINKRIKGEKQIAFKPSSAEFCVGFRVKKRFGGYTTEFLSSNSLTLDKVNVFKRRVEFIFKPYTYNAVDITFIMNVEIEDDCHFMHKNIEMMVAPEQQHLIIIDYIDCEHIFFAKPEQQWAIRQDVEKVFLEPYHESLGQPFYINGMFFGSEFPMAENQIQGNMAYIRYFSGKRFDTLRLNCGHTFKTWNTVVGASRGLEFEVIRDDFLRYIRKIARDIRPRFQYNSWYDHMLDITNENISKSFMEIEKNLSKTMVPPLHSYVVDDGFTDYKKDFWCFNSKFPEELYPASGLVHKFSSQFGLWLGPRGGYTDETPFGKQMEKAGTGGYNKASRDVCVSHPGYIKSVTDFFIENMDKFDINYWKLDGFLKRACPNKNHGHIVGGYNDMYQFTEMWENWIDVFRKIRLHRESAGKSLWINQTSYCNPSPWYLQWVDSLWIQNSGDIGFLDKGLKGEQLGTRDVDKTLSYRAERYYAFSVKDNFQFPIEYLYNHDPIYGNSANISMSDSDYRNYMMMMTTRGTAFWELYYSYNMFSPAKWRINADALRFVRNNYDILRTARFIGTPPSQSGVYGFSSWIDGQGIVSLRNSANREQKFVLTLDKKIGTYRNSENMRRTLVYPYTKQSDSNVYGYGDKITITLPPLGTVIMKFSSVEEDVPELVYGRFDSAKELLLFFDNRVYFDTDCVSCDKKIADIELLEDYSTVRIVFEEEVDSAFVSMTVKNEFGDMGGAEFKGAYYPDFVCADNKTPSGRDFTVGFTANSGEDAKLLEISDVINVSIHDGKAALYFDEEIKRGCKTLTVGDRLHIVCEPNGLLKLYINGQLECSSYSDYYYTELINADVVLSENASDLKVMSRALSYDEI